MNHVSRWKIGRLLLYISQEEKHRHGHSDDCEEDRYRPRSRSRSRSVSRYMSGEHRDRNTTMTTTSSTAIGTDIMTAKKISMILDTDRPTMTEMTGTTIDATTVTLISVVIRPTLTGAVKSQIAMAAVATVCGAVAASVVIAAGLKALFIPQGAEEAQTKLQQSWPLE